MVELARAETPVTDRRTIRKETQVTLKEIMAAVDEHAAASRAWCGRGPEVDAKRAVITLLLLRAGVK